MVLASMYENRNRRRHIAQGRAEGRELGRAEGRELGRAEGLKEGLEQGIAEGKAIGLAEAHIAWRDWLRRKEIAAANGQPFTEPTPGTNRNGNRHSNSNVPPSRQP